MKRCVLLIIWIAGFVSVALAQKSPDSLFVSFSKHFGGRPAEIVYLQTSKGIYETGEDLWFKAYQLDAQSLAFSGLSQTLYLQMVSEKDSVVWQEKYPIDNGIACGHVYVDEKLPEGNYRLEAYTPHSFYKDTTDILASRKVRVLKSILRDSLIIQKSVYDSVHFDVFPEGGNLISDIPTRLAFKATDGKGNPVAVEGDLYQDGQPVTHFQSTHHGMGALYFTPSIEKDYRIELKGGKSYSLPVIYPQGMTLRLSHQDEKQLEFLVFQSEGMPEQEILILGQMRGMVCCVAQGVLKKTLKVKIPLNEFLYQGIAEFTLFNGALQPVAERLVYLHPEKKLHIAMELEKRNYVIREKAALKIKVTDEDGNPVRANLGISVFDKSYTNPTDPLDILTHCYLSSQIRGKVYDPAYYFNEDNKDRMQAIDLLLLTQGWRRYIWGYACPSKPKQMFLTDEITGTQLIKSRKKSRREQKAEQVIQVSGAEGNSMFVWADSTGQFAVHPDMMKELRGGYVYLKPMLANEFKPELRLDELFPMINNIRNSRADYYPVACLSGYEKERNYFQPVVSQDSTILLDEVTVTGKRGRIFRDKFMGRLDSLLQMQVGMPWVCPEGHLENYKEGFTVHHDPRYCPNATIVPLKDRSRPVEGKVYRIIKPKYFNGGKTFIVEAEETVIYHGPLYSEEELLRMNHYWRTKGYYAVREFYQPDEIDMQLSTPDARNTLLWQPSVVTDEKGEAIVSFYCSDINTQFVGVAEGTDGSGMFGVAKCDFWVSRMKSE